MTKDKQNEIPESEMGMSGYSKFSWKLWEAGICNMSQAQVADHIMREQGYRKPADVAEEIFAEIEDSLDKTMQFYDMLSRNTFDSIEQTKARASKEALQAIRDNLAELKKKYTEERK